MDLVDAVILLLGLGTCARGLYALVTQDITEDNERMLGRPAVWHGAILLVLGLVLASHAIFHWPWVTALVEWVRQLE